jgi:SWI/SNF-related matrix-associated actin-dependent regulator of chromatin subfamily A3
MSGTPIQNSMQDLRALLEFLHFQPFANATFFRKHILEPISSDLPDPFRNLKLLLRVTCIRRTADLLSLPPSEVKEVTILLTDSEMSKYDGILASCKEEFEKIANMKSELKKYSVLFTTITSLRRLCNHGTMAPTSPVVALPFRSKSPQEKAGKRRKKKSGLTEDSMCEFCSGDDEDGLSLLNGLEECPECSRLLESKAFLAPPELKSPTDYWSPNASREASQSLLSSPISLSAFSPIPTNQTRPGHSSKLTAVVDDIQSTLADSKQ